MDLVRESQAAFALWLLTFSYSMGVSIPSELRRDESSRPYAPHYSGFLASFRSLGAGSRQSHRGAHRLQRRPCASPPAIELRVTVSAEGSGRSVSLLSRAFCEAPPFAADGTGDPVPGWARFAQSVAAELTAVGRPAVGMRAVVDSNGPVRCRPVIVGSNRGGDRSCTLRSRGLRFAAAAARACLSAGRTASRGSSLRDPRLAATTGADQTGVGVRADQADAGEAARDQATHKGQPSCPVFAGDDVGATRLAEAIPVDADGRSARRSKGGAITEMASRAHLAPSELRERPRGSASIARREEYGSRRLRGQRRIACRDVSKKAAAVRSDIQRAKGDDS